MCLTCGCSDGVGVRIIDPATGESTTLDGIASSGLHEHIDAEGHAFVHSHPVTIELSEVMRPDAPSEEPPDA